MTPYRYPAHSHVLRGLRAAQRLDRAGVPVVPQALRAALLACFGADLPLGLVLPDDITFMHNGLGTVVHEDVRFAGPAIIFHGVTLGHSYGRDGGVPTFGTHAFVGAGAAVLGGIRIGDRCVVAANALLTRDLPSDHLAIGNPAEVVPLPPGHLVRSFGEATGPFR